MRTTGATWVGGGVGVLLGVLACAGTGLNEVGELNSGGSGENAGSSNVGPSTGGSSGTAGSSGLGSMLGGAFGTAGSGAALATVGGGALGGSEGVIDPNGDAAGAAGQPDGNGLACPTCQLVATGQDVRGIAANDQQVFWVDYGTSDALGNYQNNGRLLARGLSSGVTTVLADSLLGPESVSLSTQYAYIFVDRPNAADDTPGVVRVPLAGGAPQMFGLLHASFYTTFQIFVSGPDYEYWSWGGASYRLAETADATVESYPVAPSAVIVAIDSGLIYFSDPTGVWTIPLAGGTSMKLFSSRSGETSDFTMQLLQGDYVYAIETPVSETGTYLTRMPKAGGAWTRLVNSPNDFIWSQVAIDGDSYFIDEPTLTQRRMLEGSLTNPTTQTTIASQAILGNDSWSWKAWTLSSVGVFLADATGLYLAPTAAL